MKTLVTGGTGFIGGRLILKLVKEGFEVRALVRKRSNLASGALKVPKVARVGREL